MKTKFFKKKLQKLKLLNIWVHGEHTTRKKLCIAEFSQICVENITGINMLRFFTKFECAWQTHFSTRLQCEFLLLFALSNTHFRICKHTCQTDSWLFNGQILFSAAVRRWKYAKNAETSWKICQDKPKSYVRPSWKICQNLILG